MHAYLHNIKTFNAATRHLTRVERSVYSDAIELYYDTEQPLQCVDMASLERRLLCRSDEEKGALKAILAEFFVLTDAGYTHARCDAEIAKYRANTSAKARAGIASAAARKQNSTASQQNSTPVEHTSTNRKPLTDNHKPVERQRATRLPADFNPKLEPEAESGIDRAKELANFRDYWNSKARDNTKLDWQATWRQWARKADRPGVSRFPDKNAPAAVSTVWHESAAGVRARADALGVAERDLEAFPTFKARVMAADRQGATA